MRKILLLILLGVSLNATSSLTSIATYLDSDNVYDDIVCEDGIHCLFSTSHGVKREYDMQRVFFSYMGLTTYKDTPKGEMVLELGYLGYAEHRFFRYEPKYKELLQTKVEYYYDTMNVETGGEMKVKEFNTVRPNLDASKVLISDKKILAEISKLLGKKIKNAFMFDTQKKYTLTKSNVEAYNNIAYYLNKENIEGVKEMLLAIVKAFSKRAVTYYTLADFYNKHSETIKMREAYLHYIWLMTKQNRVNKISKSVNKKLNGLSSSVKDLAKNYDYLSFIKWGDINRDEVDDLALFAESDNGETKLLIYVYNTKTDKYVLVGKNEKLPNTYKESKAEEENKESENDMSDTVFLSDITLDKILRLKFSQVNFHTIFRGVDNQYKFQYSNGKMKCIGAELLSYHRASGEGEHESRNYLTGKVESYSVVEVHKKAGKSKWSKVKKGKLVNLEEFVYEDAY